MRQLKIALVGSSPIAFVSFYNDEFKQALISAEATEFDQLDFMSKHEVFSKWIGRGMCLDGDIDVTISESGKDDIYTKIFSYEDDFEDEVGGVEKYLGAKYADSINVGLDKNYFGKIHEYKYASIEIVETYKAEASLIISVKDNWELKDLNVVFLDIDTIGDFAQHFYGLTSLEQEVVGIKYQDQLHEFENNFEGGSNHWEYFERHDGDVWEVAYDIKSLFSDKMN